MALLLWGAQAQALTCVRPDIVTDFKTADAARDHYIVASGRLTFDESLLPGTDLGQHDKPPLTPLTARFEGRSLGVDGFTGKVSRDVTLNVECLGPWCAHPRSGTDYIAFMKLDDAGNWTATSSPCGAMLHAEPTAQMHEALEACMNGACPASR